MPSHRHNPAPRHHKPAIIKGESAEEFRARSVIIKFARHCLHDPDFNANPAQEAQLRAYVRHLPHMTWAAFCELMHPKRRDRAH